MVLETVSVMVPVPYDTNRVREWLATQGEPWVMREDRARTTLDGISLKIEQSRLPMHGGCFVVVAQGNLATLLLGARAKAFSLRDVEVAPAVDALVSEVHRLVPLVPADLTQWLLIRADASATWRYPDAVAAAAIQRATEHLSFQASKRNDVTTYGWNGATLKLGARQLIRVYDKSAEVLHHYRGSGMRPNLGEGRLVRIEVQRTGKHVREVYGRTLVDLRERGAQVAKRLLQEWTDIVSGHVTGTAVKYMVTTLIGQGASPTEALRLASACILLADGGVPALLQIGISEPTAYRLRARIRELRGDVDDPATPERLFNLDALEYASTHGGGRA